MSQLLPPLCDDLSVGLSVHDPETAVLKGVNSRFEALTGYPSSTLCGNAIDICTPEGTDDSPSEFQTQVRAAVDEAQSVEWTLAAPEGEKHQMRVQLSETTVDGAQYVLAEWAEHSDEREQIDRLETQDAVLRRFHQTISKPIPFEERVAELLEFGRGVMDVEQGFLTNIDDGTQEIVIGVGANEQLQEGASAPYSESYCRRTIGRDSDSPMTVVNAAEEGWDDDPAFERFGLGCYVGAELTVDGKAVGTLCFADRNPRDHEFTEPQELFVELFAGWASTELERVEREQKLRQKTRAVEAAPIGVVISDAEQDDNPMVYVNDRYEQITGYSESDVVGRNCRFMQGENTDEEPVAAMREAIDNAEPVTVELRNYRKNGEEYWNRVSIAPVTDDEGEVTDFVGFQQDVTDRKEYEMELERSNERLQEFAYILSHDLQEPLRMVSSYVCLIEEELEAHLDEETQEYIDFAVDGAERMRGMIDGLLLYSRVETEGAAFEPTDLNSIIDGVRMDLEFKLTEHDAELTTESLPTIQADSDQISQLFQNLIKNAIEHGGEGTTVEISATQQPNGYRFAVSDDGPGIPPAQQDEIFGLFDKGGDSDGTGIGLAICERIVTRHDGEISVESTPGEGTTFYITLPDA